MRIFLSTVFLLTLGFVLVVPSMAYQASYEFPTYTVGSYTINQVELPDVTARAWGVFDAGSGMLLFGHESDAARPIASVTKLMTAQVALATMPLEATTTISSRAVSTEGRAGSLSAGKVMSLQELLFPLLLSSSNDAAEAFAEVAKRDTFIAAMNATADTLGMTGTEYEDPSGLSPNNVSTPKDLAKLVAHLVEEEQYILDATRLSQYVGTERSWRNINPVALVETFKGGKHGFIPEANHTLAAVFEEELREGGVRDITIVLLGSDDLKADVAALRDFVQEHIAYQ